MLQEQQSDLVTLEQQCADAALTAEAMEQATEAWHSRFSEPTTLVLKLHQANFELWHLEDLARSTESGDAAVACTKRAIDRTNQGRNDTVEQIDALLLHVLRARELPSPDAPLHSETPGQMLDRLSILSLKLFHTALEATRVDAQHAHRERNRQRFAALTEQRNDLATCLTTLWQEVCFGQRRFKQYLQLKMYNDPTLNPVLYSQRKQS